MKHGLPGAGQIIYSVPRLKKDSQVHFHHTFSPRKVCWDHWTDVFPVTKKMLSKFSSVSREMPEILHHNLEDMANRCYQVLKSLWFLTVLALGSERTLLKRQTELLDSSEGKRAAKNLSTWVLSRWLTVEREDFWISSSDCHIFSMACAPPQHTHK